MSRQTGYIACYVQLLDVSTCVCIESIKVVALRLLRLCCCLQADTISRIAVHFTAEAVDHLLQQGTGSAAAHASTAAWCRQLNGQLLGQPRGRRA